MRRILIGVLVAALCVYTVLAQPAIQVTPETVEPGDIVEVTGTGFTVGDTVNATLGNPETDMVGLPLASAQVAEDGTFTLSFTMPQYWPCCIVATPITERDLLVVILSNFEPIASAPITYNVSLAELGWQEHYNPDFDFSVMTPPDWTFGGGTDGFGFIMPGIETLRAVVILTVRAVPLPQEVDAEAVMDMTLEQYIAASSELELLPVGVAEIRTRSLRAVTTLTGQEGFVREWDAVSESGDIVSSGETAYFDLNQTVDGSLYRTIQIMSSDPAALVFFDAIVSSFTRGHQQINACDTAGEPASEGVMDMERLIQGLCALGATVVLGEEVPDLSIPIFHAPGQFVIVNGDAIQVYEFPDEASAQAVREDTSADGTIIGSPNVGWETPPHFFGIGKVIVLYVRDDPGVLRLLEQILGPQVAGRPVPESSAEPERVSWEEARQLILNGEVEYIFQAHSLEVQLTLDDGRHLITTEPSIDEVFLVVGECGSTCLNIGLATE